MLLRNRKNICIFKLKRWSPDKGSFFLRTKYKLLYEGGDFIMTILGIMFVIVGVIIIIKDGKNNEE